MARLPLRSIIAFSIFCALAVSLGRAAERGPEATSFYAQEALAPRVLSVQRAVFEHLHRVPFLGRFLQKYAASDVRAAPPGEPSIAQVIETTPAEDIVRRLEKLVSNNIDSMDELGETHVSEAVMNAAKLALHFWAAAILETAFPGGMNLGHYDIWEPTEQEIVENPPDPQVESRVTAIREAIELLWRLDGDHMPQEIINRLSAWFPPSDIGPMIEPMQETVARFDALVDELYAVAEDHYQSGKPLNKLEEAARLPESFQLEPYAAEHVFEELQIGLFGDDEAEDDGPYEEIPAAAASAMPLAWHLRGVARPASTLPYESLIAALQRTMLRDPHFLNTINRERRELLRLKGVSAPEITPEQLERLVAQTKWDLASDAPYAASANVDPQNRTVKFNTGFAAHLSEEEFLLLYGHEFGHLVLRMNAPRPAIEIDFFRRLRQVKTSEMDAAFAGFDEPARRKLEIDRLAEEHAADDVALAIVRVLRPGAALAPILREALRKAVYFSSRTPTLLSRAFTFLDLQEHPDIDERGRDQLFLRAAA